MAALTFASKLKDDGSLTIPDEAAVTLGLRPGDQVTVRIETNGTAQSGGPDQFELRRRAALRFEEADRLIRGPGKPITDPLEAAWGEGVEEKARRIGLTL